MHRLCYAALLVVGCRSNFDAVVSTDAMADAQPIEFDGCVAGEADCAWSHRAPVVIDAQNSETLVDVPVPVVLSAANFDFSAASSTGADLRFTTGSATEPLTYEVDEWRVDRAIVWVRLPILEPTGSTIFLYYGNAAASAPEFSTAVFDDDFVGIWHLADAGEAEQLDASSYNNHGQPVGAVTSDVGVLESAARFDGTSFINAGNASIFELTSTGTLSAWVRFDSLTTFASPVAKTEFGDNPNYSYGFRRDGESSGSMAATVSDGVDDAEALTEISPPALDRWYHYTARWDGSELVMFIDGERSGAAVTQRTSQTNSAHNVTIGCAFSPGCTSDAGVDGVVDEVRISRIARSNDWIATQFRLANGSVVIGPAEQAFSRASTR